LGPEAAFRNATGSVQTTAGPLFRYNLGDDPSIGKTCNRPMLIATSLPDLQSNL
jgi:hypothetical protein